MEPGQPRFSCRVACGDDLDELVEMSELLAHETKEPRLDTAAVRKSFEALLRGGGLDGPDRGEPVYVALAPPGGPQKLAGYLTVSGREWSEWKNGLFLWLGSAYIREPFRAEGVAESLYAMAVRDGTAQGAIGARSYVRLDNSRSLRAHLKAGFRSTGYVVMEVNFGMDNRTAPIGEGTARVAG
jgi:L-amino acid N-acyltransferase YncA